MRRLLLINKCYYLNEIQIGIHQAVSCQKLPDRGAMVPLGGTIAFYSRRLICSMYAIDNNKSSEAKVSYVCLTEEERSYIREQTGTMTSSNVSKELSEEISVRYPCLYGTYDIHSTTYFASRRPRVLSASM